MKSLLKHAVAVAALSVLLSACGKSRQAATDEPAAPAAAPAGTEQVVNVYNWSDYIDPEVIKAFEQATGI
jgi:spermidine/putrescine-binding protein